MTRPRAGHLNRSQACIAVQCLVTSSPIQVRESAMASSTDVVGAAGGRGGQIRGGVRVEAVTVGWMAVEAAIAIGAGIAAQSVLLTAFGLDSVIELVTGGALLWRLATEARGGSLARVERAEHRAAWVAGVGLVLLCVYLVATSAVSLLAGPHAAESPVRPALALVPVVGVALLAAPKPGPTPPLRKAP